MVNYREILRLNSLGTYSQRDIAASVHHSRNTVREVIALAEALGVKWPLADDITNQALASLLYPDRTASGGERKRYKVSGANENFINLMKRVAK